jgi:hypothetical protein
VQWDTYQKSQEEVEEIQEMKITGKASIDLKKYQDSVKERIQQVKSVVGEKIASNLADEVKKRIPNQGGWYDIYKEAIFFDEEKETWTVKAESDVELTQVPAQQSLVNFSGASAAAAVLSSFNPFPIDTIPAIAGGINADQMVLAASYGEVMSHRERHASIQGEITTALSGRGMSVNWSERPVINGKVVADLKFLSQRLEHGLGGFPRIPHWSAAVGEAERSSQKWVSQDSKVTKDVESSFRA